MSVVHNNFSHIGELIHIHMHLKHFYFPLPFPTLPSPPTLGSDLLPISTKFTSWRSKILKDTDTLQFTFLVIVMARRKYPWHPSGWGSGRLLNIFRSTGRQTPLQKILQPQMPIIPPMETFKICKELNVSAEVHHITVYNNRKKETCQMSSDKDEIPMIPHISNHSTVTHWIPASCEILLGCHG